MGNITVSSGVVFQPAGLISSSTVTVLAGGTIKGAFVNLSTETLFGLASGGEADNGSLTVSSGGIALNVGIDHTSETIVSGGLDSGGRLFARGFQIISSGGEADDNTVYAFGRQTISSGGKASGSFLSGGE